MSKDDPQSIILAVKFLGKIVSFFGIVIVAMLGYFLNDLNTDVKYVKKEVTTLKADFMYFKTDMTERVGDIEDAAFRVQ